jgi:hypothetical protein
VVVNGATDGDCLDDSARQVAGYAEEGATWWIEDTSPWRFGADPEQPWRDQDTAAIRARIAQGPPR